MARKNVLKPYLSVTSQSLATNFQTNPTNITNLDNIGIILDCVSITDNTGTFKVQVRNKNFDTGWTSNWGDLTLDTAITLANAATCIPVNLNQVPAWTEFRISFTAAGGTPNGNVTISITANQVGG